MLKKVVCNDKIHMDKINNFTKVKGKMIGKEIFEQSIEKNRLTSITINSFLEKLKEFITENKDLINKANKIDLTHNKKQIKLKEFERIVESYKNTEISPKKENKRKIVIYKGDPYITLHICIQAFIQNTKVVMLNQHFMNGVNSIILRIFEKLSYELGLSSLVDNFYEFTISRYLEINRYYDETIVIGDSAIYQLIAQKENNIKFYPYNNIAVYCESENLKQLEEAIFISANENKYEIEIIPVDDIDDAIEMINKDNFKSIALLITENDKNRERFFYEIKNKEIFVNENPFKKEVGRVYNYLK